ncbi:UNVERIFIED_CONTAM: hypothetical protein DES50_102232 [Williamsia faeni]
MSTKRSDDEFEQFEGDLRKAERKVAGEIDPGARALVVAAAVLVVMLSLVLPHTGSVSGIDVLTFNSEAVAENVTITSRIFIWLQVIFGIGFSTLALVTRRWFFAWIALCGCAVGCVAGMLAWWSRNTPGVSGFDPPSGIGAGLVVGWLAMIVLTFHWARVVWVRTSVQLSLEAQRRDDAAKQEAKAVALQRKSATKRPKKKD